MGKDQFYNRGLNGDVPDWDHSENGEVNVADDFTIKKKGYSSLTEEQKMEKLNDVLYYIPRAELWKYTSNN